MYNVPTVQKCWPPKLTSTNSLQSYYEKWHVLWYSTYYIGKYLQFKEFEHKVDEYFIFHLYFILSILQRFLCFCNGKCHPTFSGFQYEYHIYYHHNVFCYLRRNLEYLIWNAFTLFPNCFGQTQPVQKIIE